MKNLSKNRIPEEMERIAKNFKGKLLYNQKDLDPEFNDIVSNNFWDLINEM
ncbi:MAG: hypothetical protein ACOC1K_07135 [Nanoarchaeota archaeon]